MSAQKLVPDAQRQGRETHVAVFAGYGHIHDPGDGGKPCLHCLAWKATALCALEWMRNIERLVVQNTERKPYPVQRFLSIRED